jgi:hypothetical protein
MVIMRVVAALGVVCRLCRPVLIGAIAASAAGPGCTSIPAQEFTTYRTAFAAARASGEQVIHDYSAAKKVYEDLVAASEASEGDSPPARPDKLPAASASESLDEAAAFLRAWEILGQYNDFLAAIAEGRETSEIDALYSGFKDVTTVLPAKLASSLAGALGPWQPLIDLAVKQAAEEQRRRRFIEKIGEGGKTAAAMFRVLHESADTFYGMQYLANETRYVPAQNRMAKAVGDINKIFRDFNFPDEADLNARISAILDATPGYRDDERATVDLPAPGGTRTAVPAPGAADLTRGRMERLIERLEADSRVARALTEDLRAKGQMITRYRDLVAETERAVMALYVRAAKNEREAPDTNVLREAIIKARQALEVNERKEWIYELAR